MYIPVWILGVPEERFALTVEGGGDAGAGGGGAPGGEAPAPGGEAPADDAPGDDEAPAEGDAEPAKPAAGDPPKPGEPAKPAAMPDALANLFASEEVQHVFEEAKAGKTQAELEALIKTMSPETRTAVTYILAELKKQGAAGEEGVTKTRAQIAKERADVERVRTEASTDRQALAKFAEDQDIGAYLTELEKPAPAGTDPLSDEGIQHRANKATAAVLRGFLGKLKGVADREHAAVGAKAKELEGQQRLERWQGFIAANPDDFDDNAMGVDYDGKAVKLVDFMRSLTQDPANPVDLERAHRIATSLRDADAVRKHAADALGRARASNRPAPRRDGPSKVLPPDFGAWDSQKQVEWLDKNPGVKHPDEPRARVAR